MAQQTRDEGIGWILYASIMLVIVGALNFFQGMLLIAQDEIYVTGPEAQAVVIGDTTTWGWVILIIGVLELLAGFGVMYGQQWARWFGIIIASLALIGQFPVFFGAHPLWSLVVILLCAFVIYGLAAYGGRDFSDA